MKQAALTLLAVVASGFMLVLALPPSGLWVFGWFALAPVFAVTRGTRLLYGVVAAIGSSMVAAFIAANGFFYPHGKADGEAMWIYLGCALFGFVFAIVAGIAADTKDRSLRSLVILAAVGTLLDSCLLLLLPAPLALSQAGSTPMLLIASVTGIWGISFLLWLFNLGAAEALARPTKWRIAVVAVPGLFWVGNTLSPLLPVSSQTVTVGAVQSKSFELATFRRLSCRAASQRAALVVWPELSGIMFSPGGNTETLRKLGREAAMPAFVTSFRDAFLPLPHNTAELFSKQGESKPYFKRKLFGAEVKMHSSGADPVAVPFGGTSVGLNICFDSCYPAVIRDTVNQGAQIIALPTIDPESPYGFFAANHAAFTPIRAAENGVSVIRADGYAYSNIADPWGRVVATLGNSDDRIATAAVPSHGHWTLYRTTGDWFLYLCVGILIATIWHNRRRSPPGSNEARRAVGAQRMR